MIIKKHHYYTASILANGYSLDFKTPARNSIVNCINIFEIYKSIKNNPAQSFDEFINNGKNQHNYKVTKSCDEIFNTNCIIADNNRIQRIEREFEKIIFEIKNCTDIKDISLDYKNTLSFFCLCLERSPLYNNFFNNFNNGQKILTNYIDEASKLNIELAFMTFDFKYKNTYGGTLSDLCPIACLAFNDDMVLLLMKNLGLNSFNVNIKKIFIYNITLNHFIILGENNFLENIQDSVLKDIISIYNSYIFINNYRYLVCVNEKQDDIIKDYFELLTGNNGILKFTNLRDLLEFNKNLQNKIHIK